MLQKPNAAMDTWFTRSAQERVSRLRVGKRCGIRCTTVDPKHHRTDRNDVFKTRTSHNVIRTVKAPSVPEAFPYTEAQPVGLRECQVTAIRPDARHRPICTDACTAQSECPDTSTSSKR